MFTSFRPDRAVNRQKAIVLSALGVKVKTQPDTSR